VLRDRDREAGPFSQQAAQAREDLLRRHPSLAGTNVPPIAPATP
jgi:hypothetical protein